MKEIKGIIVPILTPMHEDETVNYEELVNQIERLIAAGVDPETAAKEACHMEHGVSEESFQKLKEAAEG